ncbi:calcineurin-like phosphoesterase C-terminal domain-containing protein [Chitinophaga sp. NPDC101104]|uniref:calcineurin-like phosphoesterase C-terminal domain-containing protein n=1 Tax=Chitinophaga sp. NPDC101104 TaxID=3390561 RepID=UPI003CFFCEA5
MKRKFLTACAALTLISTLASAQVKGRVFEDVNGNGKIDRKEKGIAGVNVSNGIEVVTTDAQGAYELPERASQVIFVIKPAGYQFALDSNNLAKSYYIHKPAGSPADFKYKGSAPTGDLPAQLDFALRRQAENDNFRVLVFGDPQPYTLEEIEHFSNGVVSEVTGVKNVAFGLSLGDLVGDNLSLHGPYIQAVKKVGLPWYNVIGNHDMNYDAKEDTESDETFEANFGPANYAFNYGNAHFIVLDDIIYPDPRDGKGYWGGLREDQLQFIENDLKTVPKNKLIVLSFHIPLLNENDIAFRTEDRNRLFQLLKDYPNTLSLSAHTHLQRQNFYGKEDGWLQEKPHHEYNAGTTSGDWYSGELNEQGVPASTMRDGTPKGYAFLNINGNQYSIDYKVAGKADNYQIQLSIPKVIEKDRNSSSGIYANFFMGAKGDKVEYSIDGGAWKPMEYMEAADPAYLDVLHKFDHTEKLLGGKRPSHAAQSTHLWWVKAPFKLPAGRHEVKVRATDRYGKTYEQQGAYTILD